MPHTRLRCPHAAVRRRPRLVFRPQDDTAEHELGERRVGGRPGAKGGGPEAIQASVVTCLVVQNYPESQIFVENHTSGAERSKEPPLCAG